VSIKEAQNRCASGCHKSGLVMNLIVNKPTENYRKTTKPVAYSASGICKVFALNRDDLSRGRDQDLVMA
jgi:hypothetical protein